MHVNGAAVSNIKSQVAESRSQIPAGGGGRQPRRARLHTAAQSSLMTSPNGKTAVNLASRSTALNSEQILAASVKLAQHI